VSTKQFSRLHLKLSWSVGMF